MSKSSPEIRCNPNFSLVNEAKLETEFVDMEGYYSLAADIYMGTDQTKLISTPMLWNHDVLRSR